MDEHREPKRNISGTLSQCLSLLIVSGVLCSASGAAEDVWEFAEGVLEVAEIFSAECDRRFQKSGSEVSDEDDQEDIALL